ncbi:hypothetical protein GGI42DRAFT_338324 [Trichoderma sp. SZMC 28013]
MAPISAMAPAGAQSTTLSSAGKPLKRGMSLRRASTQRQPRNHQQQLPPQFLQPMQGQLDSDEDEDTIISCHPSFQTYRHRDRQSHYVDPRQQMLHLPDSQRPASSRSHMRDWNHNHQRERSRSPSSSKKLPPPDSLSQQPQSEYYSSLPSSTSLTSEEFEALPPTVRRKYFSTLERLRFAQTCCAGHSDQPCSHSTSTFASEEDISKFELAYDSSISGSHQQPRVRSSSAHLYPNQADTFHGRLADNGERRSNTANSHHKSIILDATDEAFVKINKRQSQLPKLSSHLNEPFYHEFHPTMSSSPNDEFTQALAAEASPDSIIESFRWLDENDDLDLRLDDYQSSPKQGKKKRMPFPRHLSISKLSFGRPSSQLSRPGTKGTVASPALSEQFVVPSLPSPSGHFRRRSRALSLMSPNKGQMPDDSGVVDSAPSHYQDPEARMKLRVYLASPHKFDEAVEFGFPSLYDTQGRETSQIRSWSRQESYDKMHSSTGDDAESLISDPTSPVETVSPRTPESLDHPPVEHSPRLPHEGAWPSKVDYAQAPASSREMTLRMTLTRPDLRADEEQMYGWQKPSSSKGQAHDGSAQPRSYSQASNPKDNIERQFAIMDQEAASSGDGVVKRFWNRVRRS